MTLEPELGSLGAGSPTPCGSTLGPAERRQGGCPRPHLGRLHGQRRPRPLQRAAGATQPGSAVATVVETRHLHCQRPRHCSRMPRWMLHTDSFLNTVYRYRIGCLKARSPKKPYGACSPMTEGTPDGMTLDSRRPRLDCILGRRLHTVLHAGCGMPANHRNARQHRSPASASAAHDLKTMLVTSATCRTERCGILARIPACPAAYSPCKPMRQGCLPLAFG